MNSEGRFPMNDFIAFRSRLVGLESALWEWGKDRPEARFIHSSLGHELVPFCLTLAIGPASARWALYYRSHAWLLAMGIEASEIAARIAYPGVFGSSVGVGPMHLLLRNSIVDCNSIVAAQVPIAVGAAIAARDEGQICVCTIGDGATATGLFFEAMNVASLHRAPLLLVVEDNQVAIDSPYARISQATIQEKVRLFGIPVVARSANEPALVLEAAKDMCVVAHDGPVALCIRCERAGAHVMAFQTRCPADSYGASEVDIARMECTREECRAALHTCQCKAAPY